MSNDKRYKICVMMAMYNPKEYVVEQIDSILNQADVEVNLVIRDDGSVKREWVDYVKENYPGVDLIEGNNLGIAKNIKMLIDYVYSNYDDYSFFAYSDQDDFWESDKLITAIKQIEKMDNNLPCLYYSNLMVSDSNLNPQHMHFKKGVVKNTSGQALARYFVYACTTVINFKMISELHKVGFDNLEYDVAVYLVALFTGNSFYDEDSHIKYRMHGSNLSGQHKKGFKQLLFRFKQLFNLKSMGRAYEAGARYILKHYGDILDDNKTRECRLVLEYRESFLKKLKLLFSKRVSAGYMPRSLYNVVRIIVNKY